MTRTDAIKSLINFDRPIGAIRDDLRQFDWDWTEPPLGRLTSHRVASVLARYKAGDLSGADLEDWANLLECRDDVECDTAAAKAIFELANPVLQGALDKTIEGLQGRF